jgi:hypothetical protein
MTLFALIITTKRSYYAARIKQRMDTYMRLATFGITPVFLYADPTLTQPSYEAVEEDSIFSLTIPVPDSYIFIPSKLEAAYKYLYDLGATGIIKMDDDVNINNWECIKELITELQYTNDYIGISYSTYPAGLHPVNPKHLLLHSLKLSWYLPIELTFFLGGFYYLSRRSLEQIITHGLPFPGEDVSVAFALSQVPDIKPCFKDWFSTGKICWTYETETI